MSKIIYLNNLIKNGSFETGDFTNWFVEGSAKNNTSIQSSIKFHGEYAYKGTSNVSVQDNILWYSSLNYKITEGHIYYFSQMVRNDSDGVLTCHCVLRGTALQTNTGNTSGHWVRASDIKVCSSINDSAYLATAWNSGGSNGKNWYVDGIMLIDLTACFGFGNEPNRAWCDVNIPCFETETTILLPDTTEKTTNFVDVYNTDYVSLVKAPVIKPKFKIELLDLYENTIGEITKDISADNSGSISINYQQGVRRSCSFTLSDTFGKYRPMSNDNIFGFNTKFKIYVGLENIQTGETYWFSQGIFYTTNPTSSHANSNKTVTVNGVDKFGIFTSDTGYNQLEGTYIVPAKSKLYAVVKDILSLELGNGYMIDPKEPHIDAEFINYELPYDIKKSPGSYMGDILIELGNVLGADIFYDTNGILNITSGTTDITYSKQSSIWDFSDVLPEYSNGSVSLNTIDAINIVKVVGNQVNDSEIYIGNAENHNPLSPTAIEKIGRKIYYEESANLPNQARADEYAKYVLNSKSIIQTAIGFSSTLIPHLDVNRVITITDDYYKYEQERFIIQSITLPLDSKTLMSISCNNIASLPYYDLKNGG